LFSKWTRHVQNCPLDYKQKGCGSREPLPFQKQILFSTSLLSKPFRRRSLAEFQRGFFSFAAKADWDLPLRPMVAEVFTWLRRSEQNDKQDFAASAKIKTNGCQNGKIPVR